MTTTEICKLYKLGEYSFGKHGDKKRFIPKSYHWNVEIETDVRNILLSEGCVIIYRPSAISIMSKGHEYTGPTFMEALIKYGKQRVI